MLRCDLETIFSPRDEPFAEAMAKLNWPPKGTKGSKMCMVCLGKEGTLVPFSNGSITGSWHVHPACRHTQRGFGEANFDFRV
jgi:hypothetical protein